ncbi:DUF7310 family coiled-coil domain-containing protein [Halopelagius fulvigenes]|uniref:DUF7310 domain-containing protein n=1 Tax=Halopelagius fulvigenes TaxID=1198324 RepID=A0ABD5U0I7_9EURY
MTPDSTRDTAERRTTDRRTTSVDFDALAARLDAVERAVAADGDGTSRPVDEPSPAGDAGRATGARSGGEDDSTDGRDAELGALRERVETLEAELDAVRGLLGGVRAVDESVERKADAALAAVERLGSSAAGESDLVVERVPVDDLSGAPEDGGTGADRTDADAGVSGRDAETERSDARGDATGAEEEGDSLAARLRGAL